MIPRGVSRWAPLALTAIASIAACERPQEKGRAAILEPMSAPPVEPAVAPSALPAATVDRVGGAWVRCLGAFRPGSSPDSDLERLAQGCALDVGLAPLGAPLEGHVDSAGPPLRFPLALADGACGRVLAVGETSLEVLELAVEGPRGELVAKESAEDRWPVLSPDRPFCALSPGPLTLVVTARQGSGRFVVRTFAVPRPRP
jgi:hypothetical protein